MRHPAFRIFIAAGLIFIASASAQARPLAAPVEAAAAMNGADGWTRRPPVRPLQGRSILYRFGDRTTVVAATERLELGLQQHGANLGTLSLMPVLALARYDLVSPGESGLGVHTELGAGVSLAASTNGSYVRAMEDRLRTLLSIDTQGTWAAQLGLGVDYLITPKLVASVNGNALFVTVPTRWAASTPVPAALLGRPDHPPVGIVQLSVQLDYRF